MNSNRIPWCPATTGFWRQAALAVVLTLGGFALSGCTTPQPAIVTAHGIENPTIGYKGYKLDVPPGFKILDLKNAEASTDPRVKDCSLLWSRFAGQELVKSWRLRFAESYFIYDEDVVFFFSPDASTSTE